MFGCYNLFDSVDTGVEGTGLNLPAGDYDVPMFFNDFVFDQNCQTVFDLFNLDGILGDKFAVNGAIQPVMHVDKRRYRFRFYVPGPSRWYEFSLFDGTNFLPFWQISTDGNLLPNPVKVTSVRQAVAERVDVIVDFSKIKARCRTVAETRPRATNSDKRSRSASDNRTTYFASLPMFALLSKGEHPFAKIKEPVKTGQVRH